LNGVLRVFRAPLHLIETEDQKNNDLEGTSFAQYKDHAGSWIKPVRHLNQVGQRDRGNIAVEASTVPGRNNQQSSQNAEVQHGRSGLTAPSPVTAACSTRRPPRTPGNAGQRINATQNRFHQQWPECLLLFVLTDRRFNMSWRTI
jgi:hypothetical protein